MDKGQKRFLVIGKALSSPYASLFSRDVGFLALGMHIALTRTGCFSVEALLRRDRPEEPYQV
jgi:hypothetical protein